MAALDLARQRDIYLAHLAVERGLSGNTLAAYRRDLDRYSQFLLSLGRNSMSQVESADVARFAEALSTGGDGGKALAPSSAARAVVAVRGWHRFGVLENWTTADAASRVKPRATPQRLPKALSVDEVTAILEAVAVGDGPIQLRDKALLELLYGTGARISEAVGLDIDDLELERDAATVLLRGKGGKERLVPLGTFAVEALDAFLVRGRPALAVKGKGSSAVFLNHRGSRLSRQSAWLTLSAAAERVGLEHVSPHTLRHSFATHLISGGADVRVVQELLGHASVATTQIYTRVTPDSLREVYQLAHPRASNSPLAPPAGGVR